MRLYLLIFFLLSAFLSYSQDSLRFNRVGVIKVKKPKAEAPPMEEPVVELEEVEEVIDYSFLNLPRIFSGDPSLMKIQPYHEGKFPLNSEHIVFSFRINEQGQVDEIEYLRGKQHPFRKRLESMLKSSRWHPAFDRRTDESQAFWFRNQLVRVYR